MFELKKKKDMKKQVLFLFSFVIVLSLFSCKSVTNSSNKPLQNQHWTLVQIENNQAIEAESEPYIEFLTEENRVAGNFGCNQMLGSYELKSENSIRLELGGTRRMCADMAVEDLFSAKLNSVDQYKIEGDTLYLMTKGSPILKFVAK